MTINAHENTVSTTGASIAKRLASIDVPSRCDQRGPSQRLDPYGRTGFENPRFGVSPGSPGKTCATVLSGGVNMPACSLFHVRSGHAGPELEGRVIG